MMLIMGLFGARKSRSPNNGSFIGPMTIPERLSVILGL